MGYFQLKAENATPQQLRDLLGRSEDLVEDTSDVVMVLCDMIQDLQRNVKALRALVNQVQERQGV
jgi:hypothetical protein